MKKLLIGALLCAMIGIVAGCGGGSDNNTTPTPTPSTNPNPSTEPTVVWNLNAASDITGCIPDSCKATFAFDSTTTFKTSAGSMKITPDGTSLETKVKLRLPDSMFTTWNKSTIVGVKVYIPAGMNPSINFVYAGIADRGTDGEGWGGMEGSFYEIKTPLTNGWNDCPVTITPAMFGLTKDSTHKYDLFLSFYSENSSKVKSALAAPFYIDDIYLQ